MPNDIEYPEFAEPTAQESAKNPSDRVSPDVDKDIVQRLAEEQQLIDDPLAYEDLQVDLQGSLGFDEDA